MLVVHDHVGGTGSHTADQLGGDLGINHPLSRRHFKWTTIAGVECSGREQLNGPVDLQDLKAQAATVALETGLIFMQSVWAA